MQTIALEEIVEILRNGASIKQSDSACGIPITRIETIADWNVNPLRCGYADISEKDYPDYVMQNGDILISHINSTKHLGKCAVYKGIPERLIHGMNLLCLRVDPNKACSNYIYRILCSTEFRLQLPKITKNSVNQSSFTVPNFKGLKIPLPPLEEQKRIASILDKADAVRRKRQQTISLTDQLLRSVFLDMFGDPLTNPKKIETVKMSEIGQIITGNTPSRKKPEYYGDDVEWIKSDNINTPHHFLTKAEEYLSDKGLLVGRTVPNNSILVTCIAGSKDCIGNTAIANRTVAFNQQINAIVPNERILTLFLYAQLAFNKRLVQKTSTESMKGMVSKSKFSDIEVLLPPKQDQEKYAKYFLKALSKIEAMKVTENIYNNLFNSLTQQALNGELTKQTEAA